MSNVYTKMSQVQAAVAKVGIEKAQRNEHGRYNFRGIDDVQNTLAPILADVGLLIVPNIINKSFAKTETSGGKSTNHWVVDVRYHFINPDYTGDDKLGGMTTFDFTGEAYDTSDKGLQKALTSAYKYMLFQTFIIPVQGVDDADAEHHQNVAPGPMTKDQRDEILGMCMKTNTDAQEFAKWLGFDGISSVTTDQYARALHALKAKEQKLAEEYAKGEVPQELDNEQ